MKVVGANAAYGLTSCSIRRGPYGLPVQQGHWRRHSDYREGDGCHALTWPPHDLSTRSALSGTIEGIEKDGPLAMVAIALDGEGRLFATVTRHAFDEMGLDSGVSRLCVDQDLGA